jgi:phosphatidylserine decarboxylase
VAVGAYNVGRISAAYDPEWYAGWVTNRAGTEPETRVYDPPHRLHRGDEIMTFHLGSTVVLVFERDRVELAPDVRADAVARLGQTIARAAR